MRIGTHVRMCVTVSVQSQRVVRHTNKQSKASTNVRACGGFVGEWAATISSHVRHFVCTREPRSRVSARTCLGCMHACMRAHVMHYWHLLFVTRTRAAIVSRVAWQ